MKVESTGNTKNPALKALCAIVSAQLALSLTVCPAFADTDPAISNNTLPLAAPASTGMVKKIWSTIDLRKLARSGSRSKESMDAAAQQEAAKTSEAPKTEESTTADASNLQRLTPETSDNGSSNNSTQPPISEATQIEQTPIAEQTTAPSAPSSTQSAPSLAEPLATENSGPAITVAANLTGLPPGAVLSRAPIQDGEGPLVIDNDEAEEVIETLKYEEIATDEGKTKAQVGARFPILIISELTSKTAKKGDTLQGRLKYDLKIADRLVAKKGSMVNGHINYSLKARTIMHSLLSPERWYRNSGCLGFSFDEIINEKGEHLPLKAQPARAARIVKNKGEGRELGVNHNGQITGPWAQQIRYKAIRIGLNAALAPAGVFSFGAMPLALGVIGAANPSFAFAKPVGLNVRHRRIKGFAWGFLSGVPGSWLIEDTTVKGQEAVIKPGDEFYAEFVEEFTGEPATDAQLMPGASTKVRGQVMTETKKNKKKKD